MVLSDPFYPKDTSFEKLDCEVAFKVLQSQEKRYAHYLSRYITDHRWRKRLCEIETKYLMTLRYCSSLRLEFRHKRRFFSTSRASWEGQFITFFQTSPESPLIFVFLDKVLRSKPALSDLGTHLKSQFNFSDDDVTGFFVYCGAFLANGGNYR